MYVLTVEHVWAFHVVAYVFPYVINLKQLVMPMANGPYCAVHCIIRGKVTL